MPSWPAKAFSLSLWIEMCGVATGSIWIESEHLKTVEFMAEESKKTIKKSIYQTSGIELKAGQVLLSDPRSTIIEMPISREGWYLRGLDIEVVDNDNNKVPLTEVYLHHVSFYDTSSAGADICGGAGLDSLDALWSIGAEARGTRTFFPDGFGYWVKPQSDWLANIHLIRTDGVANVKMCIECQCPAEYGGGGSEACCPDGMLCPLAASGDDTLQITKKTYRLKYTVYWQNYDESIIALAYKTLDVAACQLEFNIPAVCPWSFRHSGSVAYSQAMNNTSLLGTGRFFPFDYIGGDDINVEFPAQCIATKSWSMKWTNSDVRLVFGKGHLHIGAINMTLSLKREGQSDLIDICTVVPRYGSTNNWPNPQIPGDEPGYVVSISNCDYAFSHLPLVKYGDTLTITARYKAAPWFSGVMGLFDIATAPASLLPQYPLPHAGN